jgi:hypothetical protein
MPRTLIRLTSPLDLPAFRGGEPLRRPAAAPLLGAHIAPRLSASAWRSA